MLGLHTLYGVLHAIFGLSLIYFFSFIYMSMKGSIPTIDAPVIVMVAATIFFSLLNQYFFYRRFASKVTIDEKNLIITYRKNNITIPIREIKILHLVKPYWYQFFLKNDDRIIYFTYQSENHSLPRSLSIGFRSSQEVKKIDATLSGKVQSVHSTNGLY